MSDELWYPKAHRDPLPSAGRFTLKLPSKGVLHSTESKSYGGTLTTYKRSGNNPQVTIGVEGVFQHMPINEASTALRNLPGGVETNRVPAIQVEVITFAEHPNWPPQLVENVRDFMIWAEQTTRIKPYAARFLSYPPSYGPSAVRFSFDQWYEFDGWCGHQHVPENVHGDPGAIPTTALCIRSPLSPENPHPVGAPMANTPFAAILVHKDGGYLEIGEDGGVFAYDAPFFGSAGGTKLNQPIVNAAWTPTQQGYYLIGRDGGIFAYGDAKHIGNQIWSG